MLNVKELYQKKLCTAEEAIKLIKDEDTLVLPFGEPPLFLKALAEHRREFNNVKISQTAAREHYDFIDPATQDNIQLKPFFLGAAVRKGGQAGYWSSIPYNFGESCDQIRRGYIKCDVFATLASPMDEYGYFSIGLGYDYTNAALEKAHSVILEVNPNVPYVYGNCLVHISQVSALIEGNTPMRDVKMPEPGEVERTMAQYVAEFIEDGSTIQVGFGPVPNALVSLLTHKQDLGIHSEMFNDGILSLIECGAVTNRKKNFNPGKTIVVFAEGTQKVYDYMHRNPALEMHPVDYVNNPYIAGKNDNLISINSTLQVDFLGQCCSESIGSIPYSGSGGQLDFVRAANISRGGKSFLMLRSTAKNGTISRIVPMLTQGAHVTVGKNDVDYIVSEFGVAHLRGKTAAERTREMIAIAHPDYRAELKAAAKKMNYM
ncbi:MAG: acetyl-CoA hydrolase/transferase family protein [Syntrophomonadaceae bacterium]|jgi:acyl-CoA hydrolase